MSEVKDLQHIADLAGREALLHALLSFSRGDFSVRLPFREGGIDAEIALAFNAAAEANERQSRNARRSLAGKTQALRLSMSSMLTLAKLLADNEENNLTARQIDYAQTIYSAGTDLLGVIDDMIVDEKLGSGNTAPAPPGTHTGIVQALIAPRPFPMRSEAAGPPYRGRRSRRPDDGAVLIASLDAAVATALLDRVRANGYRGAVATDLSMLRTLLREHRPDALILGMELADADGWTVVELLKAEPETRCLPLGMIRVHEGSYAWLKMTSGAQALDGLRDSGVLDVIRKAMASNAPGGDVHAEGIASFSHGKGLEAALVEATRFLHDVIGVPLPQRRRIQSRRRRNQFDLMGKKILIVDGDIRDIYAMTGVLERQGMRVVHAENGGQSTALLEGHPDTDAVLVDTTPPERDGCGTIRLMRGWSQTASLPIIALTARAGHEEREKCIAAGASDCLAKPVNEEQLIALLRAWLLTPR